MRRIALSLLLVLAPAFALAGDESHEETFLKNPVQLTHAKAPGEKSGEPYFSADGKRIIFQSVRDGQPYYQIYVMNADGSDQKLVSTGKGMTTCSYFHPTDADKFIYASTHLDESTWTAPKEEKKGYSWNYHSSFDIFQGSFAHPEKPVRLTDAAGYDAEGSYSHDGKHICFTSGRDGPNQIYVMDADGKNQVRISDPSVEKDGPVAMGGPFYMPGDEEVVYRGQKAGDPRAPMHVYVTNVKTKATRRLTRTPRMNWCPYPHPDGKRVVYAASLDGRGKIQVFLLKTDGSYREVRLSWQEGFDGLPSFSPDGKKVVWTSTRAGKTSEVWVADFVEPKEEDYVAQEEPKAESPKKDPDHEPGKEPHAGVIKGGDKPAVIPGADHIEEFGLVQDVRWLADPEREGRRAGTFGERETALYIRNRYEELGVSPGGPDGAWEQPFQILAGAKLAESKCHFALMEHQIGFQLGKSWQPLLYSASGTTDGDLVFCGYGVESREHDYDDFLSVELKGKIAVIFTRGPAADKGGSFGAEHPTMLEDLRFKVSNAKHHGAAGVLFVKTEGDSWLELGYGDPGIPVAQLAREPFLAILKRSGHDLDALRKEIDEKLAPRSRPLGKTAHLQVEVEKVTATSRNVIARIDGTGPSRDVIVIGAHMDHLGWGGDGSLAPGVHAIHPGADDNGSGTAGVLALARALKSHPLAHTVLLVSFGGEEMGLLGSNYFVKHPPISFGRVECMLNMDMIGRLGGKPLVVGGSGTAKEWPKVIESAAHAAALDVAPSKDGFGPSDHASFYGKDVPVFFLFTGSHADYHKPTDTADKIDGPGMERVVRFALALVREVDALPARPAVEKVAQDPHAGGGVVTGERGPYFGSVPDYAEGEEGTDGVKISGARPGSPADKAGLKAGDRIVSFDGREIKNLYDYTYAIRGAKVGKAIKVVVVRDGKRLELEATLIER
ncbi:MAG TPA: M28 family peptidase [Planctomycetota bacterium]|nr:M28 family peptidase [Planctomycetota bacterium]